MECEASEDEAYGSDKKDRRRFFIPRPVTSCTPDLYVITASVLRPGSNLIVSGFFTPSLSSLSHAILDSTRNVYPAIQRFRKLQA